MKNTEKAYLAGIIDGEGWIGVKDPGKGHGRKMLQLEVQSCDFDLIEWLHEKLGGYVIDRPVTGNRKPSKCWRASGSTARQALLWARPYIVMKRRQETIDEALKLDFKVYKPRQNPQVVQEG